MCAVPVLARRRLGVDALVGRHTRPHWDIDVDIDHLERIRDAGTLDAVLDRVRPEYNAVRLHAGISYVTHDDEHEGRADAIRQARRAGSTKHATTGSRTVRTTAPRENQ